MDAATLRIVEAPGQGGSLPNTIARMLLALVGSAMACASFGLWLVPGSDMPDLTLMKLGLSLFTLIAGMCCLVAARRPRG